MTMAPSQDQLLEMLRREAGLLNPPPSPPIEIDYYEGLQVLKLETLSLHSAPFHKRAVAFSCDAELAVAADDSVHVFPPRFPGNDPKEEEPEPVVPSKTKPRPGDSSDESSDDPDNEPEDNESSGGEHSYQEDSDSDTPGVPAFADIFNDEQETRRQYSYGFRHIPISNPALHVHVNRRLYIAAGVPFPYDSMKIYQAQAQDMMESSDEEDDVPRDEEPGPDGQPRIFTKPAAAGVGVLGSVAGTMNSVAAIEWSPSGLGRNRRPILGILTTAGLLAFYGEGAGKHLTLGGGYDIKHWEIIFAVGERFIVPPQQQYGESITSFTWARELGPGVGLLVYTTDQHEAVIVSVKREVVPANDEGDRVEDVIWRVNEIERFNAEGPHPRANPSDPDWTPCGTSFGLRWGPWLTEGTKKTSVLSYFARNYVGFRKITIAGDWLGATPAIRVDQQDTDGICLFLSTDAFLEWEDVILTTDDKKVCRGIIATPFQPICFEVTMSSGPQHPIGRRSTFNTKHEVAACDTLYPDPEDWSTNPIQGLIVHPLNVAKPSSSAIYTFIRLSATATNSDWYGTNAPPPIDPDAADPRPQWAKEIEQKTQISLPAYMVDNDDSSDSEEPANPDLLGEPSHQVFLHRFKLLGLASSPGGGSSAVLACPQSAQKPDRGGWYRTRCKVLFGWIPRTIKTEEHEPETITSSQQMTTEGRMWEWMYGGGPGVPGITSVNAAEEGDAAAQRRQGIQLLFKDFAEAQKCVFCHRNFYIKDDTAFCLGKGLHEFDLCSASGLAIQLPGISRACGVCCCRTLKLDQLVYWLPDKAEEIRRLFNEDICGRCGGKFLD